MFLERLELEDFRNYGTFSHEFGRNRVIFLGENAQGKTNLLEAIATLATASSPFTSREADLVRWGGSQAIVRSVVRKETGSLSVDLLFRSAGRRAVKVNGLHQRRIADLLGVVSAVVFSREDLELVRGAPAERRAFLDRLLLQIQPVYHEESARFKRIVTQRNHALEQIGQGSAPISSLELWDDPLIRVGASLYRRRELAVGRLEALAAGWYGRIAGSGEQLALAYLPGIDTRDLSWEAAYTAALEAIRPREIARGQTLLGPHRDDLDLRLDGREAKAFASTGQRRTIALALKLAELEVVAGETGDTPLLLLDDVLAELDVSRQNRLLEAIGTRVQTFVTSTHLSDFSADWIAEAEIHRVEAGAIRPYLEIGR